MNAYRAVRARALLHQSVFYRRTDAFTSMHAGACTEGDAVIRPNSSAPHSVGRTVRSPLREAL